MRIEKQRPLLAIALNAVLEAENEYPYLAIRRHDVKLPSSFIGTGGGDASFP